VKVTLCRDHSALTVCSLAYYFHPPVPAPDSLDHTNVTDHMLTLVLVFLNQGQQAGMSKSILLGEKLTDKR